MPRPFVGGAAAEHLLRAGCESPRRSGPFAGRVAMRMPAFCRSALTTQRHSPTISSCWPPIVVSGSVYSCLELVCPVGAGVVEQALGDELAVELGGQGGRRRLLLARRQSSPPRSFSVGCFRIACIRRLHALVDLARQRLQGIQRLLEFRMCRALLGSDVLPQLLAERDVGARCACGCA